MFFFKQKTAYEMRISDWSSDVCSSDLPFLFRSHSAAQPRRPRMEFQRAPLVEPQSHGCCRSWMGDIQRLGHRAGSRGAAIGGRLAALPPGPVVGVAGRREAGLPVHGPWRSEEHTSELPSLMRISYAVFCLKQNKQHT